MTGYHLISLSNLIKELSEERVREILSSFSCPLNLDIENFLTQKSVEFTKQGIASTYLVFTSYIGKPVLVGYFAVANKHLFIPQSSIPSNTMRKRINKFAVRDNALKGYHLAAPLIAQLGKNFTSVYRNLITGQELLKMACDKINEAQSLLSGKIVYLECQDIPKLIDFYTSNHFVRIHNRYLDAAEKQENGFPYFVQMIKYLS